MSDSLLGIKYIIAPKYWARHNVSNGYWSSEQNIYTGFHYQDRKGRIFTAEECRKELEEYKRTSSTYKTLNQYPWGITLKKMQVISKARFEFYQTVRILRAVRRKLRIFLKKEV